MSKSTAPRRAANLYSSLLEDVAEYASADALVSGEPKVSPTGNQLFDFDSANDADLNEMLKLAISNGNSSRDEIVNIITAAVVSILDFQGVADTDSTQIDPAENWIPYVTRKSETPIEFLRRVYAKWLLNGLTQADVRKADPKLYVALNNWLKSNKLPDDIYLPKKYELHENENITASDLASYRKVLAFKKRDRRRRASI